MHGVAACLLGIALVVAFAVATGPPRHRRPPPPVAAREKLPGHQGLVPPGATLVGPAPTSTALPLTVTLKPRDPAALAAEVQEVSDPRFAGLSPLPDARAVRRANSGRRRPPSRRSRRAFAQQGLTGRDALGHGLVTARVGHGRPGAVRLLDADLAVPPLVGEDRLRQRDGARGGRLGGTADRGHPRPRHAEPAAAVDERSRRRATPRPTRPPPLPPRRWRPGSPPRPGRLHRQHQRRREHNTARSMRRIWRRPTAFDPLYSSDDYGAGTTVALLEMSGAGYSSSDITTFASCYGITLGVGQITAGSVGGGRATGAGTAEAELDIETVLSLAPKANIEVYEGGHFRQPLRRLQPDRQRRHGQDRERQLDERLRGLRRPVGSRIRRTRSSRRPQPRASPIFVAVG